MKDAQPLQRRPDSSRDSDFSSYLPDFALDLLGGSRVIIGQCTVIHLLRLSLF